MDTKRSVGYAVCLSVKQFREGPQLAVHLLPAAEPALGTGSAMAEAPCYIGTFVSCEDVL